MSEQGQVTTVIDIADTFTRQDAEFGEQDRTPFLVLTGAATGRLGVSILKSTWVLMRLGDLNVPLPAKGLQLSQE
jgi:hypothetical protein